MQIRGRLRADQVQIERSASRYVARDVNVLELQIIRTRPSMRCRGQRCNIRCGEIQRQVKGAAGCQQTSTGVDNHIAVTIAGCERGSRGIDRAVDDQLRQRAILAGVQEDGGTGGEIQRPVHGQRPRAIVG